MENTVILQALRTLMIAATNRGDTVALNNLNNIAIEWGLDIGDNLLDTRAPEPDTDEND